MLNTVTLRCLLCKFQVGLIWSAGTRVITLCRRHSKSNVIQNGMKNVQRNFWSFAFAYYILLIYIPAHFKLLKWAKFDENVVTLSLKNNVTCLFQWRDLIHAWNWRVPIDLCKRRVYNTVTLNVHSNVFFSAIVLYEYYQAKNWINSFNTPKHFDSIPSHRPLHESANRTIVGVSLSTFQLLSFNICIK